MVAEIQTEADKQAGQVNKANAKARKAAEKQQARDLKDRHQAEVDAGGDTQARIDAKRAALREADAETERQAREAGTY